MSEAMCPRAGKLIGGCRFQGRYDTPLPSRFDEIFGSTWFSASPIPGDPAKVASSRPEPPKKTYVRDVCVTCGRTIERKESAA